MSREGKFEDRSDPFDIGLDVPFVPTDPRVVRAMLRLAAGTGVPSPGASSYGPWVAPGGTTNQTPPTFWPLVSPAASSPMK